MRTCIVKACAIVLAASTGTAGAWAQTYPAKPITLVVPFAAGGPTDVVARTLGAAMTRTLGQTVVIENKTGAGGTIAAAYTARATPDGYTPSSFITTAWPRRPRCIASSATSRWPTSST